MPLEGPFGVFALSGLAFLALGIGLVWSSLGKHGSLSRMQMLSTVFDDDSLMKRPEAKGDRIKLGLGAFIVGFGLMNLLAAATMGESHELGICVKMCRQEGHWSGKFGPSQREFDAKGNPLRACFCTTESGSVELTPARMDPLPPVSPRLKAARGRFAPRFRLVARLDVSEAISYTLGAPARGCGLPALRQELRHEPAERSDAPDMNPPVTSLSAEADAVASVRSGGVVQVVADLITLAKPRLTMTVVTTAMGGWFAAASKPSGAATLAVLAGTMMVVGGANALNMYLERDSDRFMARTSTRPLPSGRMAPWVALAYGTFLSLASLPILYFYASPMAALLAAIANVLYVFVYTPMKPRSWLAVWAGAVPGAIPPLLGWTASTGQIDWAGASLFGILFFWQVPHFHAIALFRTEDYTRAGLVVLPAVSGERATKIHIVLGTLALVASTFVPHLLGMTSRTYLVAVTLLGVSFTWLAMRGLRADADHGWARRYFGMSIPFLVFTFLALLFTRV